MTTLNWGQSYIYKILPLMRFIIKFKFTKQSSIRASDVPKYILLKEYYDFLFWENLHNPKLQYLDGCQRNLSRRVEGFDISTQVYH